MKLQCGACGAKYKIADEKVAGKIVTLRCKKCGAPMRIEGDSGDTADEPQHTAAVAQAPVVERPATGARVAASASSPASSGGMGRASSGAFLTGGMSGPRKHATSGHSHPHGHGHGHKHGHGEAWHISQGGKQTGPFGLDELRQQFADGVITGRTYFWRDGFDGWKRLRDLPEVHNQLEPAAGGNGSGHTEAARAVTAPSKPVAKAAPEVPQPRAAKPASQPAAKPAPKPAPKPEPKPRTEARAAPAAVDDTAEHTPDPFDMDEAVAESRSAGPPDDDQVVKLVAEMSERAKAKSRTERPVTSDDFDPLSRIHGSEPSPAADTFDVPFDEGVEDIAGDEGSDDGDGEFDEDFSDPSLPPPAPRDATSIFLMQAGMSRKQRRRNAILISVGGGALLIIIAIFVVQAMKSADKMKFESGPKEEVQWDHSAHTDVDWESLTPEERRRREEEAKRKAEEARRRALAAQQQGEAKSATEMAIENAQAQMGIGGGLGSVGGGGEAINPMAEKGVGGGLFAKSSALADQAARMNERRTGLTALAGGGKKLDGKTINTVIKANEARVRHCYESELKRDPNLKGRIDVKFTIQPSGKVSNATATGNRSNNVFVNRCIEKLVRSWKFPQYEGDATDFTFPVLLSGGI